MLRIRRGFSSMGARIKDYVVNLCSDYKTVAVETVKEVRAKPWKGVASMGVVSGIVYAVKTNPDEQHFLATVIDDQLKLNLIGEAVQNPMSSNSVKNAVELFNQNRIRRLNFVLFSVMWRADYARECDLFSAHCKALKPSWREAGERLVDVGFCGRWFFGRRAMNDYDVNESEFLLNSASR